MTDRITIAGPISSIMITASFAATIKEPKFGGRPVQFLLGTGGWIIQAKVTIRALELATVQLRLSANDEIPTEMVENKALASADSQNYATIVATLGVYLANPGWIRAALTPQSNEFPFLSGYVITAIHQTDLTVLTI